MNINSIPPLKESYRRIFIVDSHSSWPDHVNSYDVEVDLVLTYDLGLYKYIQNLGGEVRYTDHLVDSDRMDENNYRVFDFFKNWHLDSNGKDILNFKGVPFGFSFRLDIWNDLVYYSKLYLCLSLLKKIDFQSVMVSSDDKMMIIILEYVGIEFLRSEWTSSEKEHYFFPIAKYLDDRIRAKGLRGLLYKCRNIVTAFFGLVVPYFDTLTTRKNKRTVFIQEYHPTKALISSLRDQDNVKVLLGNFSRGSKFIDNAAERLLPIYGKLSKYDPMASELLSHFTSEREARLTFDDGSDMTDFMYQIIESRVESAINEKLRILDCSIKYFDSNRVDLEILIANIGLVPTLFDCVCRTRNIPSYLIINGILGAAYSDDSKYASVINAYSVSIKENYFKGMNNIVTLGDPRMDMYPPLVEAKKIQRTNPTIVIGASGFSPIDLNSYVAIEFDFMFDVLTALKKVKDDGEKISIIIKVRPNGYKKQYSQFIQEFFPDLVDDVIDNQAMLTVLKQADFYISINSQTLFEASCLGIPVLYYKKDCEQMPPPFDNKSELVTVTNIEDLISAFYDYQKSHKRYDAFLNRGVMEKYIGPLDGNNLQRNLDYIHTLLEGDDVNLAKR